MTRLRIISAGFFHTGMTEETEMASFSGKLGFILATSASAVGLLEIISG